MEKKELQFKKDFGKPDDIPEEGIKKAVEIMRSGRLHRYQHANPKEEGEVSQLEEEFANHMGSKYCMAVNSCGCAMFLALKGLGVGQGDTVFVNAHTLTPVPSAIVHSGATPLFLESDQACLIDIHLFQQILQAQPKNNGKRVLLLSHMRSRICDLTKITEICKKNDVILIEDCAHALGSTWDGKKVGGYGSVACFSTQTNKLINSGEGGLITTDDEEVAGRIILMSGSYGFYKAGHKIIPSDQLMAQLHDITPNFSMRMTDLTAALIRPQIYQLPLKVKKLNQNYTWLKDKLEAISPKGSAMVPPRHNAREGMVGSSLQFELNPTVFDSEACQRIVTSCNNRGVKVAWFGRPEFLNFTSTHRHWQYEAFMGAEKIDKPDLSQTTAMQKNLCDLPLYHTMTWTEIDFQLIADIVQQAITDELSTSKSQNSIQYLI